MPQQLPSSPASPRPMLDPQDAAAAAAHERKLRSRSKSPKSSKALPPEIRQHITHDLVDPQGFSDDQLRAIPFTNVETRQRPRRISPHSRAPKPHAPLKRPEEEETMKTAQYVRGVEMDDASVKTARVSAPAGLSSPAKSPPRMPASPRKGVGAGAVSAAGGGAYYFPNGVPSGYFSDATSINVWADDEMEAEV